MFNKIHDFVFYIVSTLYFARLIWNVVCLTWQVQSVITMDTLPALTNLYHNTMYIFSCTLCIR